MANSYADAISGIESGGRYDLLGPVTRSGDRAYGRYQVMGANVPSWTKQFFGESLTPQQFLNNPQAQDAVFQGQFGQYVNKYGPEGAARAWFAGEGGMNNPNAKDILGTSVADYSRKFTNALGTDALTPGTSAPTLPAPTEIASQPQAGLLSLSGAPAAQQNQMPGLLGNPMQLASSGLGLMSGGNDTPPQPYIAPPVRPRVDMSSLMNFLAQTRSTPWNIG